MKLFPVQHLEPIALGGGSPASRCRQIRRSCRRRRRSAGSSTFPRLLTGDFTAIFGCRAYRSAPSLPSPPGRPYPVFIPRSESEMKICRKPTFCHAESFRSTMQKIGSVFFNFLCHLLSEIPFETLNTLSARSRLFCQRPEIIPGRYALIRKTIEPPSSNPLARHRTISGRH